MTTEHKHHANPPLPEKKVDMMDIARAKGWELCEFIDQLSAEDDVDADSLAEAKKYVQTAIMWTRRAIANPIEDC